MKWLDRLFGGKQDMAALTAGFKAPDFSLTALDGSKFSLQEALSQGPVLAAFFKVSCPVCQYAFPFFERYYKAFGQEKITIVGISQNDARDTAAFAKQFGTTFPMLLDDPNGYAVSNAYGLTNVPTQFLIAQDGTIEVSSVGWVKTEVEKVYKKLSSGQPSQPVPLFKPGEQVSDFRAG
jgi:peroxiredoxin